ncbi:hypothetical protein KC318_g11591 [Hortaea werneckii]|uniref:Cytochrome b561 domain-containing protein n=2 Tax=Hortaea werneckii TaxID=91943 RepID=A0A3M7BK51_HORWE|nr:hypothetical protein KC334_g11819 [Hortaea werneckii]KAI6972539.1 hypothetical protein KC355_g11643 [Hortaea werneckii]KAI7657833.1 hypothetical protein KC318_g11591 [Hortaea werneckii]RMY40145.1 hypothetical protein D0866_01456 [Hortaea werneckii]
MKSFAVAATAISLASTASAVATSSVPNTDINFQLSIPETTASSGNGDIYFQISAPTTYSWVSLGQGNGMSGSNMFVVYTSADGNNVTVSPRLGTGQVMPEYNSNADISVLDHSGVSNGVMTANVRCGSCGSWDGGSMDFSSSSSNWIYGYRSGSPLESDSVEESISQHNDANGFTWDLSVARTSDVDVSDPFASGGGSSESTTATATGSSSTASVSCTPISSTSGCPTAWPTERPTGRPDWPSSCFDDGPPAWATDAPWNDGDGNGPWNGDHGPWDHSDKLRRRQSDNGCPAGYEPADGSGNSESGNGGSGSSASFGNNANAFRSMSPEQRERMVTAHGALAALAFVGLFPIGGILIRLASFTGLVWVHAALQLVAYAIYIAGFSLGVWLASNMRLLSNAHPVIGIILFIILFAQPILGLIHHRVFKKTGYRTWSSYFHLTIGRVAILLGIINGGLGLRLANAEQAPIIAYAVIAAIVGVVYIAAVVFGEVRRKRKVQNEPPTYHRSQKDLGHEMQSRSDSSSEDQQPMEWYGPSDESSNGRAPPHYRS